MALLNQSSGEYLKIVSMQFDFTTGNHHVNYLIFKDLEQRQRYDRGITEYEKYQSGLFNGLGYIDVEINKAITETTTAKDAILSACYHALKADMFGSWIDA